MDFVETSQSANPKSLSLYKVQVSKDEPSAMKQTVESQTRPSPSSNKPKIEIRHMNFFYGGIQALFKVNLNVPEHKVTAFIGPSGCGK
ncbi:MAG: hypothetical protein R3351_09725 [Nitrospirales bacterium]|nr:hypothetical protein [Nitrospirales bacterium]